MVSSGVDGIGMGLLMQFDVYSGESRTCGTGERHVLSSERYPKLESDARGLYNSRLLLGTGQVVP